MNKENVQVLIKPVPFKTRNEMEIKYIPRFLNDIMRNEGEIITIEGYTIINENEVEFTLNSTNSVTWNNSGRWIIYRFEKKYFKDIFMFVENLPEDLFEL